MKDVRVLIVIDSAPFWARTLLRGINEVALERGWALLVYTVGDISWLLKAWRPSAVVTTLPLPAALQDELDSRLIVGANTDLSADRLPWVAVDDAAVGELAATHLLSTGLEHFATFSFHADGWARRRVEAFRARITEAGGQCHPDGWLGVSEHGQTPLEWESIPAWLGTLPKPCGVFACCDTWARLVASYCRAGGHRVPEDISLIGADNDPLECELTTPALSSVVIPYREIGRKVAERVARGLARSRRADALLVQPLHVVGRRSSETLAVDDPLVAAAVTWIHRHSDRYLTVNDIVRATKTYRQRLEKRFRAVLNRSVMEEVRRSRVERAKHLLAMTDLPLRDVASKSGFTTPALLSVAFRRETRTTPGAFRRRARMKASVE